ncbi:MAG: hypothetical protein H6767_00130 [Candidatus Peribacteria bacterium]|nr:MAG: hypothetical protein H6767_00130 [Candidatus Peribacteria bacterium]
MLAKMASSYRPNIKVFAFSNKASSVKAMNAYFGITPFLHTSWDASNYSTTLDNAIRYLIQQGFLKESDKIVAINDIQKGNREIPIMEIINL